MIVNDEKLKKLIAYVTSECYYCPLSHGGGLGSCNKGDESCEELMLEWLQEFDIAEALEAGAHIVNDQVIFPPISLPNDFKLNVPCDSGESCISSCSWFNNCPFEDD